MRDDIHKKVPRPYRVQQWVKRAVNDADRLNGRSLAALDDAIRDACNREISDAFRRGLLQALASPPGLFGPLGDVSSARDLGSRGGHLEAEILSETKRLIARGGPIDTVAVAALTGIIEARVQADIRAAAPVLLATRDRKAWAVVNQMKADAGMADCAEHARNVFAGLRTVVRPSLPQITADEDLSAHAARGGA